MNPAEQGFLVGIWRFDLTGERRFGHQQGFGLEEDRAIAPATRRASYLAPRSGK